MSFEEAINKVIQELSVPAGQGWTTLEELKEKARELDDNKKRSND